MTKAVPSTLDDTSHGGDHEDQAFATQVFQPGKVVITEKDRDYGAPWPPILPSFGQFPSALKVANVPATLEELSAAEVARKHFLLEGRPQPYMNDFVRAARMLKGAHAYIEVGIFDRGNLSYMSQLLADDAVIVGVDIEAESERDAKIREVIKATQSVEIVIGDSRDPRTVGKVRDALGGRKAEGVFIDGGHDAYTVIHDYYNYSQFVSESGHVLFHDSLWEGDQDYKGVADALAEIDRLDPIYLIAGDWPVHRWMRSMWREPIWGVVGVLPMYERECVRRG